MNLLLPSTDYNATVPKDYLENCEYREWALETAATGKDAQANFWNMCAQDVLFWINTFVWTYNAKDKSSGKPKNRPFITYEYQEEATGQLKAAIGNYDIAIEKSRQMGASWLCLMVMLHDWQFDNSGCSFLCVSRNEQLVDNSTDPDSLFAKLRYMLTAQPGWLRPLYKTSHLKLFNEENKNVFDGVSTTGNMSRGGNRTAIFRDEWAAVPYGEAYKGDAATADTTDCRITNSTPQGADGSYYDVMQNDEIEHLTFHWSRHPDRNEGLYQIVDGEVVVIDKDYYEDKEYDFVIEPPENPLFQYRSPWYDREQRRRGSTTRMAQEVDIYYAGSDALFFDVGVIDNLLKTSVLNPRAVGTLDFHLDSAMPIADNPFQKRANGSLQLWLHLDAKGKPPAGRKFVVGCDIAAGTGASNSTLSVADALTGEKVAGYANPRIRPERFARVAVAISRWFNDAFLLWENNGIGLIFSRRVQELTYPNIYYREAETRLKKYKKAAEPGWHANPSSKELLLGEYREALATKEFINHSKEALEECRKYMILKSGGIEHMSAMTSDDDPSGANANHGDRVIADGLCFRGVHQYKALVKEQEPAAPRGSYGYRTKQAEDAKQSKQTELVGW